MSSYFNSPAVRGDAPMGVTEPSTEQASGSLYESAYSGATGARGNSSGANQPSDSSSGAPANTSGASAEQQSLPNYFIAPTDGATTAQSSDNSPAYQPTSDQSAALNQAFQDLQTNPAQGVTELMTLAGQVPGLPESSAVTSNLQQLFGSQYSASDSAQFAAASNPTDLESIAMQDMQTNPVQGIEELMQVASTDSNATQDVQPALQQLLSPSQSTGDASATALPQTNGDATQTALPQSTGDATPTALPQSTGDATPTALPQSTGDATPTALPQSTGDATQTALPQSTSDATTGLPQSNTEVPTTQTSAQTNPLAAAEQQALQNLSTNPSQGIQQLMEIVSTNPNALQDPNLQQTLLQMFNETSPPSASANFSAASDQTTAITAAMQDLQGNTPLQGLGELLQLAAQDPEILNNPQLALGLNQMFESGSSSGGAADTSSALQQAQQAIQALSTNPAQGIMSLMELTATNPAVLQDPTLQSALLQAFQTDSAPAASQAFQSASDQTSAETAALQDLQGSNPLQGLLELMQLSAQDPAVLQDQQLPSALASIVGGNATNPSDTVNTASADASQTSSQTGAGATGSSPPSAAQVSGIENQALQMIQSGDPTDGVRELLQLSQVSPNIVNDQSFLQNLQSSLAVAASQSQESGTSMSSGNAAPTS